MSKYWNRPYSKRLYDQTQASIDKINFDNEVYEKSLSEEEKKIRDFMQNRRQSNE
tara:strand:- start:435 stop:599 length:165 start_codon:yes stop_codon:yes gene_type:complete